MARRNDREKLKDFGEKIGGAKKDLYTLFKEFLFTAKDIENLNYKEVIENINKKSLLKKPDYLSMAEKGVPQDEVYLLKRVYDSFPTTFCISGTDEAKDRIRAAEYTELCKGINANMESFTGMKDFPAYIDYMVSNGFMSKEEGYYTRYAMTGKGRDTNLTSFANRLLNIKHDQYSAQRKIRQTNFPYKPTVASNKGNLTEREKQEKKYKLLEMSRGRVAVVENKNHGLIIDSFNNNEDAQRFYDQFIEMQVEKAREAKCFPTQLSCLRRKGKDYTEGKDVTPELFMKTFQFRGVEFGNWNSINDRQENLNWAFNALMDLADLLSISPSAISLNGKLALAFGSRGSGNALAHYESARVVINLTKMRGAGSLAHEWMHALDDYLGRLYGSKAIEFLSDSKIRTDNEYRPIYDQMQKVMESIKYEHVPFEAYKARLVNENETLKTKILGAVDELKKGGLDLSDIINQNVDLSRVRPKEITKQYKDHVQTVSATTVIKLQENLSKYSKNDLQLHFTGNCYNPRQESTFYKMAKEMPQKYWSKDIEMLARSFGSYIDHALRNKGLVSDYLQRPVLNSLMHLRTTDTTVFDAFDQFFKALHVLDRTKLIPSNMELVEQVHEIEAKEPSPDEPTQSEDVANITNEQNPAVVDEPEINIKAQHNVKPINKDELKTVLTENTISSIEGNGETYTLYPAFLDDKKNFGGYVLYNTMSNKETYDSLEAVVSKLAESGIGAANVTKGYKALSYEVLPNCNNYYEILCSQNTFTARVSENFAHRTDNIDVPFFGYKKDGMVYVTSNKENKEHILSALREKDKEIGRYSYKDICTAPGKTQYVELSPVEYEILQLTKYHYAAYEKGQNVNVVIKEKDVKNMLTLVGREYDGRIATRSYVDLRGKGFPESIPFSYKDFIDELKEKDIRCCGITNETKSVYTLLIHNDDKQKYFDLKDEYEQKQNRVMNLR